METSESIKDHSKGLAITEKTSRAALYAAMAKAFPEIEGATKDKNNPAFRSKYADLGNVIDAIKPALSNHGLWFRQVTHRQDGGVCVETLICHESGEEVSCGELFIPASKNDAHGYGSALTYCKRYSLQTAFGVAPDDDDGNAASKPNGAENNAPSKPITKAQLTELQSLVSQTGTDTEALCNFYKIGALPELPAHRFDHAKSVLEKRLPEQKEAS